MKDRGRNGKDCFITDDERGSPEGSCTEDAEEFPADVKDGILGILSVLGFLIYCFSCVDVLVLSQYNFLISDTIIRNW